MLKINSSFRSFLYHNISVSKFLLTEKKILNIFVLLINYSVSSIVSYALQLMEKTLNVAYFKSTKYDK